jgi:diaminopropionate ammonia-lyase
MPHPGQVLILNPGARRWTSPAARTDPLPFHRSFPGYRPTPLVEVPALADELSVGRVVVKDESDRLGLPAFKILGASWAVNRLISAHLGHPAPAATLDDLCSRAADTPLTLVTATDGNHGRAIARMAALLGLAARAYVPRGLSDAAVCAIRDGGADVVESGGAYDDVVRRAADSTVGREGELLVQDTAWTGYEEVPRWVVEGYATLFAEIDRQLLTPDLVVVPAGVGSLLQAAVMHYRVGGSRPAVLAVEPVTAACIAASLRAGTVTSVPADAPTILTGLNCGTPSLTAWPTIRCGLDAAASVTDDEALRALSDLDRLGVPVGPCGAAALAGVRALLADPARREAVGVDRTSVVVLVSTEGPEANPVTR